MVRQDVDRHFLEVTRGPAPRAEGTLRRVADRQLPANAGEILPPFHVTAVDAAPEEVVDAAGEHLAQQILHRRETAQGGQPRGVAVLDPSPGVAEEVVDVEDRDVLQGQASPVSLATSFSTSSGESNQYSRRSGAIWVSTMCMYQSSEGLSPLPGTK